MFIAPLQREKAELKKVEERDRELQERASLSVPLVPETEEDMAAARKVAFTAASSREERKRKRLEIKTQSMFGVEGKKARTTLLKVCSKMDGGVLERGRRRRSTNTQELRNSLGIRTPHKL